MQLPRFSSHFRTSLGDSQPLASRVIQERTRHRQASRPFMYGRGAPPTQEESGNQPFHFRTSVPHFRFRTSVSVLQRFHFPERAGNTAKEQLYIVPSPNSLQSVSQSVSQSNFNVPCKKCSQSNVAPMRLAKSTQIIQGLLQNLHVII